MIKGWDDPRARALMQAQEVAAFDRQFPRRYNQHGQLLCRACFGHCYTPEGGHWCVACKGTGIDSRVVREPDPLTPGGFITREVA